MKKRILSVCAVVGALVLAGCSPFSKVQTITGSAATGFTTNTITVVNTNNLQLDATLWQQTVAGSVSALVLKYPDTIGPITNVQAAVEGVLNGANQSTTQEALTMLKLSSNPVLAQEATSLIQQASAFEQTLLQKYGSTVAGQIINAMLVATDRGINLGLTVLKLTPPAPSS